MKRRVLVYPQLTKPDLVLFRLRGEGLGNLLFPYFRAYILAKLQDGDLVWPPWLQIKLKTLFEPTRTRRTYYGLFTRPDGALSTVGGRLLGCFLPTVSEKAAWAQRVEGAAWIPVAGLRGYFAPLLVHASLVKDHFRCILSPRFRSARANVVNACVVHVRLGDFATHKPGVVQSNVSMPPSYYSRALDVVKQRYGSLPIYVISDACRDEVLARGYPFGLPNITILDQNEPLEDLVLLSAAAVRVASASTFSMWGAFLSGGPTLRPSQGVWHLPPNLSDPIDF